MKKWLLPLAAGVVFSAGCTTTSMKGTPFYGGEYEMREGPVADRVNLWPLVYYRDPAWSVLWPLMELSPSHQAVRPIYSAYDLDTDRPIYNVLWPISRFDPGGQKYRIFPVYWGDDYFNVFPLYWHEGQPFSGTGHDALFPLWIWKNRSSGNSLHLVWPFYARHRYDTWKAWHLWPLYGMEQQPNSLERDIAWPLIHSYTNSTSSGNWAVPLYSYAKNDTRTTFLSLPYSRSLAMEPGGASWDLALPLWHRQWEGDKTRWAFYPALSWGRKGPGWSGNRYLLGLAGYGHAPDLLTHYAFPLYYYSGDPYAKAFYTLPWWWKKRADGSGFNALIPLYYHGYSDRYASFYSLPWMMKRYADGYGWHTSFPLYFHNTSPNSKAFYSLPWFSKKNTDGSGWNTTIPLYYHGYSTNSSAFYSLLWMSEKHPDDTAWRASFPFYYSAESADGSIMITPFYARKLHDNGTTAWRCFIPLVYVNEDYDSHFMTLLGGRWRLGDQRNWLALPLLSGGARDASSGRNIYLGGLAAQHWDEGGSSNYIFPFYYRAPQQGTFVSLPYSAWKEGERSTHVIPPLLSGWYDEGDQSRALLAAGLAGYRAGGDHPYHYLFPLYYRAPKNGTFMSIPYSTWRKEARSNHLILPLLSGWYSDHDASGGLLAAGLAGYRAGGAYSFNYVFPFYYTAPQQGSFLSLPYATWRSGPRQRHSVPLLLSGWSTGPTYTDCMLLAGLGYWRQGLDHPEGSHLLPFYAWSRDHYFYSLIYGNNQRKSYYATPLVGRYRGGSGKSGSWAVPLYWHKRDISSDAVKGYWFPLGYYGKNPSGLNHGFLGLYDYEHRTQSWNQEMPEAEASAVSTESKNLHYLLFLGKSREYWRYTSVAAAGEPGTLVYHSKNQSLFPLWSHRLRENPSVNSSLKTSSLLGVLYDTRHERGNEEEPDHDYLRRRVLWRLYHYERLNGDMSTDVFPGITVDSYKNGYYKFSVLWRMFRYEKDPESGDKKLDLLFIPLKR